jgi:hypothetical protein
VAPLGRYLGRQVVVNDVLLVDGDPIAGEDPRAAEVAAALELTDPDDRADGLRQAGIRYVLREVLPGVGTPDVSGEEVHSTSGLRLQDLGAPGRRPQVTAARAVSMASAWVLWCALPLLSLALTRRRTRVEP